MKRDRNLPSITYVTEYDPAQFYRAQVIARLLAAQGVKMNIAHLNRNQSRWGKDFQSFRERLPKKSQKLDFLMNRLLYLFWGVSVIPRLLGLAMGSEKPIFVVHNTDFFPFVPAWIVSRLCRTKIVIDYVDVFLGKRWPTDKVVLASMSTNEVALLRRADGVIFCSVTQEQIVTKMLHKLGLRCFYLPMAAYNRPSGALVSKEIAKALLKLSGRRVLVYSGVAHRVGQTDVSGIADAIEALSRLSQSYDNLTLILQGVEADENPDFVDLVTSKNLRETVVFQGPFNLDSKEYGLVLSAADVLLLTGGKDPSILTARRLKTARYVQAGRPIVATWTPELALIFQDGRDVVFARVGDPASLADAIDRTLRDSALSSRIAANSLKRYQEWFSEDAAEKDARVFVEELGKLVQTVGRLP